MRQIEDIESWFSQPNTGTIETAAAPFWRLALHLQPKLKIVVIRRNPVEAAISATNAGMGDNLEDTIKLFKYLDHKLGQIEKRVNCKSYQYNQLDDEKICQDIFEYLLPYSHDHEWWARLSSINIQIDPKPVKRYIIANCTQINRLIAIARQKSLSLLFSQQVNDVGGLDLSFEPLGNMLNDSQIAMREHCTAVGEHPDNFNNKNIKLFQAYEDTNALQVTVARSNGRVFGYLISIIGESLETPGKLTGCHTVFYASPDYPGLGLKLQRKAIEGLRQRGVNEVVMRAGTRGEGDRISTLYKRLGAKPEGTFYRIEFGDK